MGKKLRTERKLELVSLAIAIDQSLFGELGQTRTDRGGTHAAEFAQLLD
jgi:hypothetical protein